jgi:peptide/nickel transport system permease protein
VKLEVAFERLSRGLFGRVVSPQLNDKLALSARGAGRTGDLFLKTWMGKVGLMIIIFFLIIVILSATVFPYDQHVSSADRLQGPSAKHLLGTDQVGRDLLLEIMAGTSASLTVGFVAMALAMGLGTLVGLASGYWGGRRDEVLMRLNDVFLSLPWLVLMIVVAAIFRSKTLTAVILVIGLTSWSTTARIVRSQVLSIKTRQFVERARAIGAGDWHIIRRHIFPNTVPLIFANAILMVAIAILSESTLSFLGLGATTTTTWGRILEYAYLNSAALAGPWTFIIMPGLCIVFTVLGFTFVGYAMDEVLNPKLRQR